MSLWRWMTTDSEEYKNIKELIGKEKIPIAINIVFESKVHKYVTVQSATFYSLRQYIEH